MAICKIGGLLLRHFFIVFNGTTATATISSVANWYIYIYQFWKFWHSFWVLGI